MRPGQKRVASPNSMATRPRKASTHQLWAIAEAPDCGCAPLMAISFIDAYKKLPGIVCHMLVTRLKPLRKLRYLRAVLKIRLLLFVGVGVEGLAIVPLRDYLAGQLLALLQLSDTFVQSL